MKRTDKEFDCVEMKNAIQKRLVSRRRGMTGEAFIRDVEATLARSSAPVVQFWRSLGKTEPPKSRQRAIAVH